MPKLPGAHSTVGEVAAELWQETEHTVEYLEGLCAEDDGESRAPYVPGTLLRIGYGMGRDGDATTQSGRVYDATSEGMLFLLAQTKNMRGDDVVATRVQGYRGREINGDYQLGTTDDGLTVCRLGKLGVRGGDIDEPMGEWQHEPSFLVGDLRSDDRQRLNLVVSGVRRGIEAIESIVSGADASEVLRASGRLPARA